MSEGLLDTSVFIALESGRALEQSRLPADLLVSVITVGELEAGVLRAESTAVRATRLRTAQRAAALTPLPVDAAVAHEWARLSSHLRDAGRRMKVNDLWIASVAARHELPVVTQDSDFEVLAELGVLEVIQV